MEYDKNIEENILLSFYDSNINDDHEVSFLKDLENGKFLKLLNSSFCDETFKENLEASASDESFETALSKCVESFLDQHASDSRKQLEVLCVGVACLSSFVQANWTGPPLAPDEVVLSWLTETRRQEAAAGLEVDGEGCYTTVRLPELLVLARAILRACSSWLTDMPSGRWWWVRTLFMHQQVLDEYSPTLHSALMALLEEASLASLCATLGTCAGTLVRLEAARIHLYYTQVLRSKEQFTAALQSAGMKMELVGALGRRTRFQQHDLPQLTLKVDVESPEQSGRGRPAQHLPKDLRLDDEVRLDHIKFASETDGKVPDMTPTQQAIVLGMFVQTQKCQPQDELMGEELAPYLQSVLNTPQWWSLQMAALLFRCRLESHHSRTVERAMMQAQVLVDSITHTEPGPGDRLWGVFCSHLPPYWQVEAELARLLISLGSVNSALDIYLRLEMWEEVIVCYNLQQLRHKAAEVIERELAKRETVKLLCLLGDATDDTRHYERAWELSEHRSGRAQRHWGLFFFNKKQYDESIPHLQQSLACNSLQVPLWLRLGYAALETEDWELCATSYRRYCNLDTENFEAWNNLAKAYVKMGQKARAWKALQEALKCNYENWRVWDNLLVVSTDCGEFEEMIRAYHRILDLKEKHVDTEVLRILVEAVGQNLPDNHGVPAGRLLTKALGLFGRLTGQVTDNSTVWRLYAELTASGPDQTPQMLQKTAQHLQKAHRCAVQSLHWEKEIFSCKKTMELCSSLADAYLQCCRSCPDKEQAVRMLSSAKFSLKGVITKVTQVHTDPVSDDVVASLKDLLLELLRKLELIICEAGHLQSAPA